MTESTSIILRFGPYSLPQGYGVGDTIECTYRGREVVIAAITNAPVQWFSIRKTGKPFVILCGDLIRAVQTESETAIAHNWGVNKDTVRKWRRALNVGRMTVGTTQVFRTLFESRIPEEVAEKGRKRSRSKKSREKMIASKTGKPMHDNTRKALLIAVQKPKSDAHREAMSQAHKGRGTRPPDNGRPWTKTEDKRLGTAPDRIVALELDRSVDSIRKRRSRMQIPKYLDANDCGS
jgi:transposase-like protein